MAKPASQTVPQTPNLTMTNTECTAKTEEISPTWLACQGIAPGHSADRWAELGGIPYFCIAGESRFMGNFATFSPGRALERLYALAVRSYWPAAKDRNGRKQSSVLSGSKPLYTATG